MRPVWPLSLCLFCPQNWKSLSRVPGQAFSFAEICRDESFVIILVFRKILGSVYFWERYKFFVNYKIAKKTYRIEGWKSVEETLFMLLR